MRLVRIGCLALATITACTAWGTAWAQDRPTLANPASAPVVVEFDAAGNPLSPNRPLSCAELREREAARNAERERALAAGLEPPRPYISMGTCVDDSVPATGAVASADASGRDSPEAEEDWRTATWEWPTDETPASTCSSDPDLVASSGTQRPQYDANGALIRTPAASCGSRYGALTSSTQADLDARGERDAVATRSDPRDGRIGVETESSSRCTEDRLRGTRTCSSSGSISIGNSEDGRNAARDALDWLRPD